MKDRYKYVRDTLVKIAPIEDVEVFSYEEVTISELEDYFEQGWEVEIDADDQYITLSR